MKHLPLVLTAVLLCSMGAHALAAAPSAPTIPVPERVTLLDLGSDCLPCDLQDRIVRRVEKSFADTVSVIFIDVEKYPENKKKYGIDIIPTLIFYDKNGKEVARQSGYMKENDIRRLLKKLTEE